MSKVKLDDLKGGYDKDGFVVVKDVFNPDEIAEIEHRLQRFIKEVVPHLKRDEINYTKDGAINSIHRLAGYDSNHTGYFDELLHQSRLSELAAMFLGDEAEGRKVEYFAKPAKVGMKSPWHQDNFYWCVKDHRALTIWVALDGSDEENGAVKYISGSHGWGLIAHQPSFAPGSSQMIRDQNMIEDNHDKIYIPHLRPGDCLVHHSLTVHGSDPNISDRSRRGVTFQYKAKSSEYDQEKLTNYLKSLSAQVDARSEKT